MILIDIGNTNIVFAVSANNLLIKIKRISANENKNKLKLLINNLIKEYTFTKKIDDNNVAIISSVVPNLNSLITLRQKVFNRSNISFFFIDRRTTKDYDFVSLEEKSNSFLV